MIRQSHGVGLLDGLDVQTLLLHHRLHLPLQGAHFSQPATKSQGTGQVSGDAQQNYVWARWDYPEALK